VDFTADEITGGSSQYKSFTSGMGHGERAFGYRKQNYVRHPLYNKDRPINLQQQIVMQIPDDMKTDDYTITKDG
jgi:hypothetical protein